MDSTEGMEDYYVPSAAERQEQEEAENRRIMSEIEKACAENDAKALTGDQDNADMGDGQEKAEKEEKGEKEGGEGEAMKDEGMGESTPVPAPAPAPALAPSPTPTPAPEPAPVSSPVKEEAMAEDKPSSPRYFFSYPPWNNFI